MEPKHLILQDELRQVFQRIDPSIELIEGSIQETIPLMVERLKDEKFIVGVGDVTADILVDNQLNPSILLTDGKTKRTELDEWRKYEGFEELIVNNPPGEITLEAWESIIEAIDRSTKQPVHLLIEGEEDLLALPLLVELPNGAIVIYGIPNKGSAIRVVNDDVRDKTVSLLNLMKEKQ